MFDRPFLGEGGEWGNNLPATGGNLYKGKGRRTRWVKPERR